MGGRISPLFFMLHNYSPSSAWLVSRRFLPALSLFWLLVAGLTAQAQTIRYVSTTGTNATPATATSWATSTTDLQGAINASSANDQVWVAGGTYKPGGNANTNRTISFAMKNGVVIYGGFAGGETSLSQRPAVNLTTPSNTTLSGEIGNPASTIDNSYHVISNPSGLTTTAILDGFVITGGNADGVFPNSVGGGMYNAGNGSGNVCSPTVRNCAFQDNSTASPGGAIYNDGVSSGNSSPRLTNCAFQRNSASQGGAMFNEGSSSGTSNPVLTNCVLFGNGGSSTFVNDNSASITASYSLFDNTVTGYSFSPTNLTTTTNPFASTTSTQLRAGSPAIDAGNSSATGITGINTDLAGNPRIQGCQVDMGAYEFQNPPNLPTSITAQPGAGSSVCAGNTVTATVSVTGTVTAYQWYKGGAVLTGNTSATTATLSLPSVTTASAGSYSVVVTGACNSLTSTVFSLSVSDPVFAGPPTFIGSSFVPGQVVVVSYSAAAGGCGFKPNSLYSVELLSGASNYSLATPVSTSSAGPTSLTFTIPANLPAGTYKLQVVYGDPVYSPVSVTFVVSSLTLTITASSTLICVGQPVSLTAAGCGVGGTYQWSTGQSGPVIIYTPVSTSLVSVTCITAGGPRLGVPDEEEAVETGAFGILPIKAEADRPAGLLWRRARRGPATAIAY